MKGLRVTAFSNYKKGSKGIRDKMFRPFAGKTLAAWNIERALNSTFIDELIIGTNDERVVELVNQYADEGYAVKCFYVDSPDPGGATYSLMREYMYAKQERPKYVVSLTATAPLITAKDIDHAVVSLVFAESQGTADGVETVYPSRDVPFWAFKVDGQGSLVKAIPEHEWHSQRQFYPQTYHPTAMTVLPFSYFADEHNYPDTYETYKFQAYIVPEKQSIEINTDFDFALAESLMKKELEVPSSWFDNVHVGRRAWVMGTGPGLWKVTPEQWEQIDKELTIGVNNSPAIHDPQYLVMSDPEIFTDKLYEFMRENVCNSKAQFKLMQKSYIKEAQEGGLPDAIPYLRSLIPSGRFSDGLYVAGTCMHAAINLALTMGCDPIILLGLDYCEATHARPQPHDDESRMWDLNDTSVTEYKKIAALAKKMGRTIINGLPHSRLPYFPKLSVDEILSNGHAKLQQSA